MSFVSDRGSNFVKALRQFSAVWCLAHRLNNVLKLCFFTTATKAEKTKAIEDEQSSDESDDEFGFLVTADCLTDLPKKALYVIRVVMECKALVKYVKKVRLFLVSFVRLQ
jgi:hypothetical protein